MSSKAQGKKPDAVTVPHEDRWRSGRARFGLQRFRMGRDKKWHFAGQQADETVAKVVRQHWLFLVLPALPLIGSFGLLVLLLWSSTRIPNPLWPFFEILTGVLIVGTGALFLWKDGIEWYLTTYIITNKRIINSKGVLNPSRQSTPLENVKQVGIDIDTFWGFWLRYGIVHVYLTGGDFIMENVPNPKMIKDAIDGITDEIKNKKPEEEKPPIPANNAVAEVITKLAEGKEVPKLENADEHIKNRRPERRLGPHRTFGGILHIPSDVHYTSGEFTVKYIQRSRYVLYRQLALPVLALLIALPTSIYFPTTSAPVVSSITSLWWGIMGLIILGLLVTIGLIYTNYADDVFIFTNKRIIDIDRRFIFFYEMREEIDYKNIRDLKVKIPNLWQRILDIGDVYIEVAGAPGLSLRTVDHPFIVLDKISEIQKNKEKADKIKSENDAKKELHMWFGKVMTTLVETTQVKGAPNLVKLELLEAMERANELGFQVIVCGEEPTQSVIPPGCVVRQSPPPGTVITAGGDIQVVLSR
ncbi:MAG: hypothetical protein NVSMB27_19960 [Ktedonobacteraceae bacterium]